MGNDFSSYLQAVLGRKGGATRSEQLNRQGNHMISQTLCLTAKGEGWHVDLYWQDIQEDARPRFIGTGQNKKDGLWGVSMEQSRWPFLSGSTVEVLQTTDQSGPWHDRDGMVFGGNVWHQGRTRPCGGTGPAGRASPLPGDRTPASHRPRRQLHAQVLRDQGQHGCLLRKGIRRGIS